MLVLISFNLILLFMVEQLRFALTCCVLFFSRSAVVDSLLRLNAKIGNVLLCLLVRFSGLSSERDILCVLVWNWMVESKQRVNARGIENCDFVDCAGVLLDQCGVGLKKIDWKH
jgi:hypothetical protein